MTKKGNTLCSLTKAHEVSSTTNSSSKNDFVFILGKNWKASLAELLAYTETRDMDFSLIDITKSFLAASTSKILEQSFVDELGGTIKLASRLSTAPLDFICNVFVKKDRVLRDRLRQKLLEGYSLDDVFRKRGGKYLFGVSVYPEAVGVTRVSREIQRFVGSLFKQELKKAGIRASFMGIPPSRRLPQLTHVEVIKKQLIRESAEILFCISQKQAYLARTEAVHNPFEFQKRDIGRPIQRKIFSIPPRLARIMTNLASCSRGKVFLDPFCGVGTILQEALLTGARVTGVDIDQWCVNAARTNLEWLKREYQLSNPEFKVMQGDTRRLTQRIGRATIDCIATEPELGPPLKQVPTEPEANRLVTQLAPLFNDLLRESFAVLKKGSKLAIVSPFIRTQSQKFVRMPIREMAESEGFTVIPQLKIEQLREVPEDEESSFIDIEERHKIGREIHVLQK